MRTTLKHITRLLLSITITAAAACGGDGGSTGPDPEPGPAPAPAPAPSESGTYSLTGVRTLGNLGGGGSGLPVNFIDGSGDHLTFLGGTLVLGTDGRFDLKVDVTFNGSSSQLTDYGTYSAQSGSVAFASEKSTPRLSTATASGNAITAKAQVGSVPFEIDLVK
jgi:hypothetical protein